MSNLLTPEIQRFLRESGFSKRVIAKCTMETRLYHDLRIYGDIAWDCLEVLSTTFSVDLSQFQFDRYFPAEFPGRNAFERQVFHFLPGLHKLIRKPVYEPITLAMIDQAISRKAWRP